MKLVHRIDTQTGIFLEDVIYEEKYIEVNGEMVLENPVDPIKGLVDVQPVGFYRPKWDFTLNTWVEGEDPAIVLESKKSTKKAEIKTAYEAAVSSGFTCSNGIIMDSELLKVQMLKSGYDLAVASGVTTMDIRDFNNVVHTAVILTDVDLMIKELSNNIVTLLQKKWSLEAQIDAATDETTLNSIVW